MGGKVAPQGKVAVENGQPVHGNALGRHLVARDGGRDPAVVAAIAGDIDDSPLAEEAVFRLRQGGETQG